MSLDSKLYTLNKYIDTVKAEKTAGLGRVMFQLDFANNFMRAIKKEKEWTPILEKAADLIKSKAGECCGDYSDALEALAPIGKEAKKYKIHCIGHAHIDMNWMWSWPETANDAHDTFYTVDKLMDEFPEAKFSQSQVSLYKAMQDYFPALADKIRKRIKSGNWECTASNWVEGEKNCASGEALCRHMLYSRRYLKKYYGLEPEDVKVDWSADIFGHAATIPSIMTKGGVTRYYHTRPYDKPDLFIWKSKDGSELLTLRDPGGYNGNIDKSVFDCFCRYISGCFGQGVRDFMWCYGWGDHGGGPTRVQIRNLLDYRENYPILPTIDFSTADEYYSAIEKTVDRSRLPVIEEERNFVFEGCYTSQANVKYANRYSEIELPSAETLSLIAGKAAGTEYPQEKIEEAWQRALFSQFHDVFPGSGVRATYNYAQGSFQEVMTTTSAAQNQSFRDLGAKLDTASLVAKAKAGNIGDSFGAGTAEHGKLQNGFATSPSPVTNTLQYDAYGPTTAGMSGETAAPILVYNPKPWKRTESVTVKIWNKKLDVNNVFVYDETGEKVKAQFVDHCDFYWFHKYDAFVFEAKDIPALGYKVFVVDTGDAIDADPDDLKCYTDVGDKSFRGDGQPPMDGCYTLENKYLRVKVHAPSAALVSVVDKETGFEYVKQGEKMGTVEYQVEAPNGMPAWNLSPVKTRKPLEDGNFRIFRNGPNLVTIRAEFKVEDSVVCLDTSLAKNSRKVDFVCRTRWFEVGDGQKGIPTLRAYFPTAFNGGSLHYEIPFGAMERIQSAQEVPALKWMNLSGKDKSVTLVNRAKYGHRCQDDTISLTLLRSSYAPDPYPEMGDHEIEYSMVFDGKAYDPVKAVRDGEDFNNPVKVVSAPVQAGPLPTCKSFGAVISDNVNISALKRTEDGNGIVVRLYELCGKDTKAEICLCGLAEDASEAFEADVLERPLSGNTAKIEGGRLTVDLKAYSNTTVVIK